MVATYNVHQCVGSDGRRDPDRVGAVLRELDADVVALQEVDSGAAAEGSVDQFEYLAEAARMLAVPGPTLRDHRGHFGNALLTRLPVVEARRIDLSVPGREPRGAVDAALDVGGRSVRVLATHLGLRWRERRVQVARLTALVRHHAEEPLVLLGDMNEWLPLFHSLAPLARLFGRTPRVRTFPAALPLLPLDRIWARPAAGGLRTHATRLARRASDHLPLRAEVLLGAASPRVDSPWHDSCPGSSS